MAEQVDYKTLNTRSQVWQNRPNYPNELLHRRMASLWLISLRPLPTTLSLQMEIWLSEPETTPGLLHRTVARHPYWLVVGNLGAKTSSLPEHPLTHRYSHQPALLLCNWPPFRLSRHLLVVLTPRMAKMVRLRSQPRNHFMTHSASRHIRRNLWLHFRISTLPYVGNINDLHMNIKELLE